jgi:hypothetical protein
MNMYISICLSQMLVSSHNDVLQEFQELRHEFFLEIFRKLNIRFLSEHSDGVRCKNLKIFASFVFLPES